ncbi:rRNA maturation RNase YbeY [Natranaerobius thermophilus]|uniref:rRNA maturation RNase YbeY n=1 Tax=Natranaerobius thermophilus TaxID=375929 RepID=UPI000322E283|nr:rRNA maturation RNase YbeY [Natranaerobius thermophilus]
METTLQKVKKEIANSPGEVGLMIVDAETIKELNRDYRNQYKSTDVLSFPQYQEDDLVERDSDDYLLLGDIVISESAVLDQADKYGHSIERELAFLFLHGLLHLLGYDHEKEEAQSEEESMFVLQEEILSSLGITRQ